MTSHLVFLIYLIVIEAKNFFNALSALLDMVSLDFFAAPDEVTDEAVAWRPPHNWARQLSLCSSLPLHRAHQGLTCPVSALNSTEKKK